MRLTIIGASGHGKVIADIACRAGYDEIVFLDDETSITACGRWLVTGRTKEAEITDGDLFVGIGNPRIRKMFMEKYEDRNFPVLIHPDAVIADDVSIGAGTVVMAGTVINPGASIGRGCIINTSSSVDHDCRLGNYVHVAVGSHLCGTVTVGDMTWLGAGSIASNNVDICSGCVIGAGAVVVGDIEEPGTYVGVPAVRLEK